MTTITLPILYSIAEQSTSVILGVTLGGSVLQASTANVKLAYAGTSTIDVTLPGIDQFATLSTSTGTTLAVKFNGVTLLSATLTKVTYNQSPNSAQIDLTASVASTYSKTGSIDITDIFSRSGESGDRSFDAAVNSSLRPGMTAVTAYDSFSVGAVSFVFGFDSARMSVEELTADTEARQAQIVASGVADRGYRAGSVATAV